MGCIKILACLLGGFLIGGAIFFATGWFTSPDAAGVAAGVASDPELLAVIQRLTQNKLESFDVGEDVEQVDPNSLRDMLFHLSNKTHPAGFESDEGLAVWIQEQWDAFGLDVVERVEYEVLLSYPKEPNFITLENTSGQIFQSHVREDFGEGNDDPDFVDAYLAYATAGVVEAEVVYVNYGDVKDFALLADPVSNFYTDVQGKICLCRYGQIFRGNKVENGAASGCAAMIIFSDPADVAPFGLDTVYPDDFWLPASGIQRGSTYLWNGDPETPGWPSLKGVYRVSGEELSSSLPKIPAQPIGYADAKVILQAMGGSPVPVDWQGGIQGVTYNLGGVFNPETCGSECKLKLTVNNELERLVSSNVMGTIRGSEEPDRYVMIGNHRDAWGYGSVDPSSGTAQMMEVARILGNKVQTTDWRPRRSIVFLSWGAEEFGLIGSTEFSEHYSTKLKDRGVAYVNCDICVAGTVLRSFASPTINHKLVEASKSVPSPFNPEESYYQYWSNWVSQVPGEGSEPKTNLPGAGSDHAAFIYNLGIPVIDFAIKPDYHEFPTLEFGNYPTYHTGFETFKLVDELLDPGFVHHKACSGLSLVLLRTLADDLALEFEPREYDGLMQAAVDEFAINGIQDQLTVLGMSLAPLQDAIDAFRGNVETWELERNDPEILLDPLALRKINDQAMKLDRHFLLPNGLPNRIDFAHGIISPSIHNSYGAGTFPGITDLLYNIEELSPEETGPRTEMLKRHLSDLVLLIYSAGNSLKADI